MIGNDKNKVGFINFQDKYKMEIQLINEIWCTSIIIYKLIAKRQNLNLELFQLA